jgi:hypothetical protein
MRKNGAEVQVTTGISFPGLYAAIGADGFGSNYWGRIAACISYASNIRGTAAFTTLAGAVLAKWGVTL